MGTDQLVDVIGRLVRHFVGAGQLPTGIAQGLTSDLHRYARTGTAAVAGDSAALGALVLSMPPRINEGLRVTATRPTSDFVNVSPGEGYAKGNIFHLSRQAKLRVPITEQPNAQVWWVVLVGDEHVVVKRTRDKFQDIVLAKIVAAWTDCALIRDHAPESTETHDAYIISGRDPFLGANVEVDDATIEAIKNVTDRVRASALIGDLTVSEQLRILSSDGSIQLTDALRIYGTDDALLAVLSRDGLYYYSASGRPLARFTGEDGASRLGGFIITPEGDLQIPGGTALVDAAGDEIVTGEGVDIDALDGDHLPIDFTPDNYTPDTSPPEADDENDLTAHLDGIDDAVQRTKRTGLKSGAGADLTPDRWQINPDYWRFTPTHERHHILHNAAASTFNISGILPTNAVKNDRLTLTFESGAYNWYLSYQVGGGANKNIYPMDYRTSGDIFRITDSDGARIEVVELVYNGSAWIQVSAGRQMITYRDFDYAYSMIVAQGKHLPVRINFDTNRILGRQANDIAPLTATQVRTLLGIEAGSTADQTAAEIAALINASAEILDLDNLDANVMSAAEHAADAHTMTIDGRDVSVDGTKLDGVEANATADLTGAEIVALINAVANLIDDDNLAATLMRDAEHAADAHTMSIDGRDVSVDGTKLDGISSGADVTGSNPPQAHAASHQNTGSDEVATATPGANDIPKSDGSGKLDGWISDGSTTVKGKVELAADGESAASVVVQGNDSRLSDARTPSAHDLGGAEHNIDVLADLNAKISDATLDDASATRDPNAHASEHTDGTDDIQDATAAQKGVATAAQITKLDAIEALADVTDDPNVRAALAAATAPIDFNDQALTEIKSLVFQDGGSTVDIVRDEDNMASDDAAALATQQSIKAYVAAQGSGTFGTWQTLNMNQIYQTDEDGFLIVVATVAAASGNDIQLSLFTDSNTPPTIKRGCIDLAGQFNSTRASAMCPVKAGDYFKATIDWQRGTNSSTLYWITAN